jgi:hypothetical protein
MKINNLTKTIGVLEFGKLKIENSYGRERASV